MSSMQLSKYAYPGKGAAAARPRRAPRPGPARWAALSDDVLLEALCHLDDRQIAQLARLDKRTRRLARAGVQRRLGLGDSQYAVFRAVLERREHVLLLGPPGSGKSHLLKILRDRLPNPLITASTGAAAEKIGAATIHSALGLGIGNQTARQIVVGKLTRKYKGFMPHPALEQICGCKALVIDEVSMLTAKLLDLAFEVLEMVRTDLPQFVVTGDPMQLNAVGADKGEGPFFESGMIKGLRAYVLTESFRQTEDSPFLRILNRARLGKARESDVQWLRANVCPQVDASAPRLFCLCYHVGKYNSAKLDELPMGTLHLYRPQVTGKVPSTTATWMYTTGRMPDDDEPRDVLHLKVGARVVLSRNLPEFPMLHNGSCGTVASLTNLSALVNFDVGVEARIKHVTQEYERDGQVVGTRTYMPLMLAWAVSIHRAQGATLDAMYVDLSKCFTEGQAYVALSRVREAAHAQVDGLALHHLNNINKGALAFYNECAERSEARIERHRERERQALEREADVSDDALAAMMDAFERGGSA